MASKLLPYLRKTLYLLSILILFVLLFYLQKKQENQICSAIQIKINAPQEKELITPDIIKNKLNTWYVGGLSGVSRHEISLLDIENRLEELPAIKNAEVSFDLKGELTIEILQHLPIVRISNPKESYYIAEGFIKIPTEDIGAARVPIVSDTLSASMIKKVYTLSTYVQENPFMQANTEQIFVENGDLAIVPKVMNQEIVIGDTLDLPEKFDNLKKFYVEGLHHLGWDRYQSINLKYKNQIICK